MTELPKIVVQRLPTATNAMHPDPDVITAFVEKSLSERERDQVLGHLAQCSACREVVVLSFPEQEAALPAAAVRPAWMAWPVLRWGALAACVAVVGAAVTLHRQFRASSPAALSAERSDTPRVAQEQIQTTLRKDTSAETEAKAKFSRPDAKADLDAAAKKLGSTRQESLDGLMATAKTANPQAPVPASTEAVEVNGATAGLSPAYEARDEAVPGRAKDALQPTPPSAATAMGGPAAKPSASNALSGLSANKRAFAAVGLSPRWTLSADGTLQRSLDYGRTWETVAVADQSSFRALAADGQEIWVGGGKGALYHSSDAGQNWMKVQPVANGEVLSGDIIGVEFIDKGHGTVTTSGQEKWVTADAGENWHKQ